VAWGVRKSSTLNNLFTTLNLLTVCTVIVSGFYFGMYLICLSFKYYNYYEENMVILTWNAFKYLKRLGDLSILHYFINPTGKMYNTNNVKKYICIYKYIGIHTWLNKLESVYLVNNI